MIARSCTVPRRRIGVISTFGVRAAPSKAPIRVGVTLLELLVALAIIAMMAGVAGTAFSRRPPPATWRDTVAARIARARAAALETGHAADFTVVTSTGAVRGTALPDGSVLALSGVGVERLTGRLRAVLADSGDGTGAEQREGHRAAQP